MSGETTTVTRDFNGKWLALTGGVGGAKLAYGLNKVLSPEQLTIVVNTADDFTHLGLSISPDLDTLLYHLSERQHPEQGWGLADESWRVMESLAELGGEDWFRLGDKDLATHLFRTHLINQGATLAEVTETLFANSAVAAKVLPMSNDKVSTMVKLDNEELSFQDYFVRHQCKPQIRGVYFAGVEQAEPVPQFLAALNDPQLSGVILCPSNPFVSIDPILSLKGVRERLSTLDVPVLAVSPIIGGQALKGPAAKMMSELGLECSAASVFEHYQDFLDIFVIDKTDESAISISADRAQLVALQTIMRTSADKITLAREVLETIHRYT